jgi:hypothetical protein
MNAPGRSQAFILQPAGREGRSMNAPARSAGFIPQPVGRKASR